MEPSHLQAYCGLLDIKYKAAQRNMIITGAVFLIALAAFFALGMLGRITGLELFVAAAILIAFGLAFISSLTRRDILASQREMCRHLIHSDKQE